MSKKIKLTKYSIDDILQHNTDKMFKRKIIFIFDSFYDETGLTKDVYYQTIAIEHNIPPTPLNENAIDKYYTKV